MMPIQFNNTDNNDEQEINTTDRLKNMYGSEAVEEAPVVETVSDVDETIETPVVTVLNERETVDYENTVVSNVEVLNTQTEQESVTEPMEETVVENSGTNTETLYTKARAGRLTAEDLVKEISVIFSTLRCPKGSVRVTLQDLGLTPEKVDVNPFKTDEYGNQVKKTEKEILGEQKDKLRKIAQAMTAGTAHLIPGPQTRKLNSLTTKSCKLISGMTIPFARIRSTRLVPNGKLKDLHDAVEKFRQEEINPVVEEVYSIISDPDKKTEILARIENALRFRKVEEQYIQNALVRFTAKFEYLVNTFRERVKFEIADMPIGISLIDSDEEADSKIFDHLRIAVSHVRDEFIKGSETFYKSITEGKRLNVGTFHALEKVCDNIEALNITNDPHLLEAVTKFRKLTSDALENLKKVREIKDKGKLETETTELRHSIAQEFSGIYEKAKKEQEDAWKDIFESYTGTEVNLALDMDEDVEETI